MGISRKKPGFWSVSPVKRDPWSQPGCWVLCVLCVLSIPAPCGKTSLQLRQGGKLKEHPPSRGLEAEAGSLFSPLYHYHPLHTHRRDGAAPSSPHVPVSKHDVSPLQCWVLGGHIPPQPCQHPTAASPACNNQPCAISGAGGSLDQPGSPNSWDVLLCPHQGCAAPRRLLPNPRAHGHVLMERMQEEEH